MESKPLGASAPEPGARSEGVLVELIDGASTMICPSSLADLYREIAYIDQLCCFNS